jgi:putative pyruvate formate lyase activating enzyme
VNRADRFVIDDFEPAYLALHRAGELAVRAQAAVAELRSCRACPRDCGVDRTAGAGGALCHTGRHAIVASAFPHFGEEDCLRGRNGSGTIFFRFCNLRCVFCQNWDISQQRGDAVGRETTADGIAVFRV